MLLYTNRQDIKHLNQILLMQYISVSLYMLLIHTKQLCKMNSLCYVNLSIIIVSTVTMLRHTYKNSRFNVTYTNQYFMGVLASEDQDNKRANMLAVSLEMGN